MNRQLTIKELSAYLPYGVEVKDSYNGQLHTIDKGDTMDYVLMSYNTKKPHKIILYPLSSLTNKDIQDEIMIRWGGGLSDKAKENWLKEVTDEMMYTAFNALRYDFVELMLEKHIDLFGLIPSGLAIDKTTL